MGSSFERESVKTLSRQRLSWERSALVAAVLALVVVNMPAADAKVSPKELVALRTEVDDLASELEAVRADTRADLARLRAERSALQRRLKQARAQKSAASSASKERGEQLAELEAQGERWVEPLRASIGRVKEHVSASLPFQRAARLAELTRLEGRLDGSNPDLLAILKELWRLVEQEATLAGDIGLGRQAAEVNGQRQLVEVVRLGDALLYFRTGLGAVGVVQGEPGQERWTVVEDEAGRGVIQGIFDKALSGEQLGPVRLLVPEAKAP